MNNIKEYFKESSNVMDCANALDTGAGRAIMDAIDIKTDRVTEFLESSRINSEDMKKDIRYQLGYRAALRWVRGLPAACKELGDTENE